MVAINTLIFLGVFALPEYLLNSVFHDYGFEWSLFIKGYVWRIITAMFLHANATHLFFNMVALHRFGEVLEEKIGTFHFLVIYFLSAFAGSILYGITGGTRAAVGASGAIFG